VAEKVRCENYDRNFKNQEGLEAHNKAKHPEKSHTPSSKSKPLITKKTRNYGILIIVLALIAFWIFSSSTATGKYDTFAQCLTEKGAKMYGAYWCPHCLDQKKSFGKSFEKVNYIECSLPNRAGQNQECNNAGIQSYPTWEFSGGERLGGNLPLLQLSEKTGCPLTIDE
jgi:hypothetical protein